MTQTKQILVVEDKEQHLESARVYFSGLEGVTVTYATNLRDAETAMHRQRFDGVISDIFFPMGYEGVEKQQRADTLMERVEEPYRKSIFEGRRSRSLASVKNKLSEFESALQSTPTDDVGQSELEGYRKRVAYSIRDVEGGVDFETMRSYEKLKDSNPIQADRMLIEMARPMVDRLDTMVREYDSWKTGDGTPPLGIFVAESALVAEIPVVYCTDLWHHSTLAEPLSQTSFPYVKMIDTGAYGELPTASKNWEKAYQTVIGETQ